MSVVAEQTEQTDRETLVREIFELEALLEAKRAMLPVAYKQIFTFRCHPEKKVLIYAGSLEEANEKLHARMNRHYGDKWQVVSKTVERSADIDSVSRNCPGNLLRCLTESDAKELIRDYEANQKGRTDRKARIPQPERDIQLYEKALRQRENSL